MLEGKSKGNNLVQVALRSTGVRIQRIGMHPGAVGLLEGRVNSRLLGKLQSQLY